MTKQARISIFIRDYLFKDGEYRIGTSYEMWQSYDKYCTLNGFKGIKYQNFTKYIYVLKELGLISVVDSVKRLGEEFESSAYTYKARPNKSPKTGAVPKDWKLVYYRAEKDRINSPMWNNAFLEYRKKKGSVVYEKGKPIITYPIDPSVVLFIKYSLYIETTLLQKSDMKLWEEYDDYRVRTHGLKVSITVFRRYLEYLTSKELLIRTKVHSEDKIAPDTLYSINKTKMFSEEWNTRGERITTESFKTREELKALRQKQKEAKIRSPDTENTTTIKVSKELKALIDLKRGDRTVNAYLYDIVSKDT